VIDRLTLGAPGVYQLPLAPLAELTGVRMDVAAFVGVAPRGPARQPARDPGRRATLRSVPVAVESWDDYRRLYGSFEGPGLLPYAVASFFEQGGARAYIVRIVHAYQDRRRDPLGVARARLGGLVRDGGGCVHLRARSEGTWGNAVRAAVAFEARPLLFESASVSELVLDAAVAVAQGSLLRLTDSAGVQTLRFVSGVRTRARQDTWGRQRVLTLEAGLPAVPVRAETVLANLDVDDRDPRIARSEQHQGLGLSPDHPRWLAAVLEEESSLLRPARAWADLAIRPLDPTLLPGISFPFRKGKDRFADITPEDLFDASWTLGDEQPGDGVQTLAELDDLSLLVVPDLYSPGPLLPVEPILDPGSLAGPTFEPCVVVPPGPPQVAAVPDLEGLRLDPELPGDLALITSYQQRLVRLAQDLQSFVVLLDVPPRLARRDILRWRASFAADFAAAYHPWLKVSHPGDDRTGLVAVNPSAAACGIIARREHLLGVPFGPANELATGVVDVDRRVPAADHDELHQSGVNVYLGERDGIRLTAARTLSRDLAYRQLSVRRLVTMLRRVLEQQTQWMVFEPNNQPLRTDVGNLLSSYLRELYLAGAFTGATESEAYFVRCDEALNPPAVVDAGELVAEVGVAPAEPLEFIVLRVRRDADGSIRVEGGNA
jgi:uncharacterized protein